MRRPKYALLDAGVAGNEMWGRKGRGYAEIRKRQKFEHDRVREHLFDAPVGYTFEADTYCPGCILFQVGLHPVKNKPYVFETLQAWARERGIDMDDETSYDSSAWPKVIWESMVERPETCGRCAAYFGQNPNEAPWCASCEMFSGECGHF